ncbi:MAG: hypothetical protein K8V75_06895 [Methanobrevibacter woesei]|nr:hypothetical protein [Methanobrevibacter woesei]
MNFTGAATPKKFYLKIRGRIRMRDIRDIILINGIAYDEERIRNLLLENEKICSQNEELLEANNRLAHNMGILEEQNKMLIEGIKDLRVKEA